MSLHVNNFMVIGWWEATFIPNKGIFSYKALRNAVTYKSVGTNWSKKERLYGGFGTLFSYMHYKRKVFL